VNIFQKEFDGGYNTRIFNLHRQGKDFLTPNFIPSFSSRDDHYLKERLEVFLPQIPQQTILISAYDYFLLKQQKKIDADFIKRRFKRKFLFLDSGGYELQFSEDKKWNPSTYAQVLNELNPDFYVGYDRIPSYTEISDTKNNVKISCDFLGNYDSHKERILLFHFSLKNTPINEINTIFQIIQDNQHIIDVIGFPERELGPNIIQACVFIKKLRYKLDEQKIFKPIHIFGCSDPKSIILFVLNGADLFDGIGWIKYAFSLEKYENIERTQIPFIKCLCEACEGANWSTIPSSEYEYRLLLHNLVSIDDFFSEIRNAILQSKLTNILQKSGLFMAFLEIDRISREI
jgi:hypothetical protein